METLKKNQIVNQELSEIIPERKNFIGWARCIGCYKRTLIHSSQEYTVLRTL